MTVACASALAVAGFAAYFPALKGVFLFDDIRNIVENPSIRNPWALGDVLFSPQNMPRPVVGLTLAVNYAIGGLNPLGYHLFNILIHIFAAITLFAIVRRTLNLPGARERYGEFATTIAFGSALLWVVHPLQTSAVAYIIQRAESLMGLFFLLTLYCTIRGAEPNRTVWNIAAIAACILGAGTKQIIAAVPILVLLYDRTFISGTFKKALARAPLLYAGLFSSWAVIFVLIAFSPPLESAGFGGRISALGYLKSQAVVLVHYLRLSAWPLTLCLNYEWPVEKDWARILPCGAIILGLVAISAWKVIRNSPWGFVGAWFFVILAPTSSFMPIADIAFEHRMYLSLAALTTVFCIALLELSMIYASRLQIIEVWVPVLFLATVFVILTYWRSIQYQDNLGMWRDVLNKRPKNLRALTVVGSSFADKNPDEAIWYYASAIEIQPGYADAYTLYGQALLTKGDLPGAIEKFRKVIAMNPLDSSAWNLLGEALRKQGKSDESMKAFEESLRLNPNSSRIHNNLGHALTERGRATEAEAHFREAIRLHPENADAHYNFANALAKFPAPEAQRDAFAHYEKALAAKPEFAEALTNLGNLHLQHGNNAKAEELLRKALQIDSKLPEAHNGLGIVLASAGKFADALNEFNAVLGGDPRRVDALSNAASALIQLKRFNEALENYRKALAMNPEQPKLLADAAWLLATCSDAGVRNGAEAVKFAEKANELAHAKNADVLDVLAAAYAESGDFEKAIAAAKSALKLAQPNSQIARAVQQRRTLYESAKPYREK